MTKQQVDTKTLVIGRKAYTIDSTGLSIASKSGPLRISYEDIHYIIPNDCAFVDDAPLFLHIISRNGTHVTINVPTDYNSLMFVRELVTRCHSIGNDIDKNIKRAAVTLWFIQKTAELIDVQRNGDEQKVRDTVNAIAEELKEQEEKFYALIASESE